MTESSKIVQNPAPVLRKKAKAVDISKIKNPKISRILKNMRLALEAEEDGVALAAPQIGVSERIFIVSPKAFLVENDISEKTHRKNNNTSGENIPAHEKHDDDVVDQRLADITEKEKLVYINPIITRQSRETKELEEGCLSVRWLYGNVKRHTRATVRAHDEEGKPFSRGASGLLAQIFQHETDHLDGVLFIDKAKDVKDLPPKKESP